MKKFCLIVMSLIFAFCGFGCYACKQYGARKQPKYVSQYTEEEHRERIATRTREKYAELLADGSITFEVYTVYAFYDNDPEYFLIEFSGEEYNAHILGSTNHDNYSVGLSCYGGNTDLEMGKSFWSANNVLNLKKYYGGGIHAYEIDGRILGSLRQSSYGFSTIRLIERKEYKHLMNNNFSPYKEKY